MKGTDVLKREEERQQAREKVHNLYPDIVFPEPVMEDMFYNRLSPQPIEGKKVIVDADSGHIFDVTSDKYDLVYHEEIIHRILAATPEEFGRPELEIKLWHHKSRVRVIANFPELEKHEIVPGDPVQPRVIALSSYDRSMDDSLEFGAKQLVCTNGLIAYKKKGQTRRKHIIGRGLGDIQAELQNFMQGFSDNINLWRKWAALELEKATISEVVENLPFSANEQEKLLALPLLTRDRTPLNELPKITLWDVNSAATQMARFNIASEQRTVDLEMDIARSIGHIYDKAA